jgi:hypothetical protein
MKMKKLMCALTGICIVSLVAGSAMAGPPSAKFAATWSTKSALKSAVIITDVQADTGVIVDSNTGFTLATIKVPQGKELLVGVSAEIGLVTDTSVKGKNGGTARAIADAEAFVTEFAVPRDGGDSIPAAPGTIMLSRRVQELGATLGGVIQSCAVTCVEEDVIEGDIVVGSTIVCEDIVIVEDCEVTDEEISLLQNTTAAHHFNFVLPNMDQGVYDIKAVFTTGARAEVDICDFDEACMYDAEGTVSGSAEAIAIINKTMVTVQQVRAAKGGLNLSEITIIEP